LLRKANKHQQEIEGKIRRQFKHQRCLKGMLAYILLSTKGAYLGVCIFLNTKGAYYGANKQALLFISCLFALKGQNCLLISCLFALKGQNCLLILPSISCYCFGLASNCALRIAHCAEIDACLLSTKGAYYVANNQA
jgi:hypothetical protein